MHNRRINQLYLIAIAIKVSLIIVAIVLANSGIVPGHPLLLSGFKWEAILEIFSNSDSNWYRVIATHGYTHIPQGHLDAWSHPELHFAFFPLYPFCVGAIMKITGFSFYFSGFIFNLGILYLVVRYFFLFLVRLRINEQMAFRIVLLLLLFPFSLHFYFLYTESLFFALLLACYLFISKKQWWQFGISSALIVLTRPNGIFLMLPFVLFILDNDGPITWQKIRKAFKTPSNYIVLVMPLVFFLWMVYQWQVTGNFLAFKAAQEIGWHKTLISPFKELLNPSSGLDRFISFYCMIFMLIAVLMVKKWKLSFQFLVWMNILLPLSGGSLTSMTRYLSILFPYHMALGTSRFANKYFPYIIILFIILQLVCFKLWMEGNSLMY